MILPVGGTSYGKTIDISSRMACHIVLENYQLTGRTFVLHVRGTCAKVEGFLMPYTMLLSVWFVRHKLVYSGELVDWFVVRSLMFHGVHVGQEVWMNTSATPAGGNDCCGPRLASRCGIILQLYGSWCRLF
ncbi:hypothetical protein OIU84_021897 [Salix udensis]|uniref:Uncharacterized protein n=1 Tax=Salix udensis TaxID=889485 RepID=A0AAD6KW83_9ROSI|nr:hypothetical protein OIU84_021897 [Salix udensis]